MGRGEEGEEGRGGCASRNLHTLAPASHALHANSVGKEGEVRGTGSTPKENTAGGF